MIKNLQKRDLKGTINLTNLLHYNSLTAEEKLKYKKQYLAHPLAEFIDWKAYFASDDGNEMHFVKSLGECITEDNKVAIILEHHVIDDMDYKLVYVIEDEELLDVPDNEME